MDKESAIEFFSQGYCLQFAIALQKIILDCRSTQLPIFGFYDNEIFCHAFLKINNIFGIDVFGKREIESIKKFSSEEFQIPLDKIILKIPEDPNLRLCEKQIALAHDYILKNLSYYISF